MGPERSRTLTYAGGGLWSAGLSYAWVGLRNERASGPGAFEYKYIVREDGSNQLLNGKKEPTGSYRYPAHLFKADPTIAIS